MRWLKAILIGLILLGTTLVLSGCAVVGLEGEATLSKPNLSVLEMEPYTSEDVETILPTQEGEDYLRVDLWLEATQGMGGINPHDDTIYPHYGWKFREGGFHYRFRYSTGWYEDVLKGMLYAAQGSRTRVLRYGNERLPDAYLMDQGLVDASATPQVIRSLRRDLLTYEVDPLPTVFSEMSQEQMQGSFYSPGSPMMNRMARFMKDGGVELENPGMVEKMDQALARQIDAIASGRGEEEELLSKKSKEENDYPLLYALENIDLSRLNVILCDPASLRALSGTSMEGKPIAYIRQILEERGIYTQGLAVGLYVFRLDYVGQLASLGAADFREPLIWGKPIFDDKKQRINYLAPMPRLILALVIGEKARVNGYMEKLNARLDSDEALQGLRGPLEGELTYTRNGMTITQQPFRFQYWHTVISRPDPGFYTQHSQGALLKIAAGEGRVANQNGLQTAFFTPDQAGKQEDRIITLTFPLLGDKGGTKLELSSLKGAKAHVISAIQLTQILPSSSQITTDEKDQVLALRDRLYVYSQQEEPFIGREEDSPFTLDSLALDRESESLVCTVRVDGAKLKEGYYRVKISADLTDREMKWLPVPWIDGKESLSAAITREDITLWETFSQAIHEHESDKKRIAKAFSHAWGPYTNLLYHGMKVPDFPPVEKAPGLEELVTQIRQAASIPVSSFVRFVFDAFVDHQGSVQTVSPR